MAFRSDEAAANNYEKAKRYLLSVGLTPDTRKAGEELLLEIIKELGPVVDGYPTWHPLVSNHDQQNPETLPSERTGYKGLDHTICFASGFITCPYGDGDDVIDSVMKLNCDCATISAEKLDAVFYSEDATPILVRCEWHEPLDASKLIPKHIAIPLMLEQELPAWRWANRAENWDVMRPYLLGEPHGSRSSFFLDQVTALAIKKMYMAMIDSGMFGPVK